MTDPEQQRFTLVDIKSVIRSFPVNLKEIFPSLGSVEHPLKRLKHIFPGAVMGQHPVIAILGLCDFIELVVVDLSQLGGHSDGGLCLVVDPVEVGGVDLAEILPLIQNPQLAV